MPMANALSFGLHLERIGYENILAITRNLKQNKSVQDGTDTGSYMP